MRWRGILSPNTTRRFLPNCQSKAPLDLSQTGRTPARMHARPKDTIVKGVRETGAATTEEGSWRTYSTKRGHGHTRPAVAYYR